MALAFGSLFSGIGGIDLGFERAGLKCLWQVEIDEFCRSVLAKHWPDVPKYADICDVTTLPSVDVICGGFPCQDVSNMGTKEGVDGSRSGLWHEFARIIRLVGPRYVVVENVAALLVRGMDTVLRDLAELGFDAEWQTFSATRFLLPHRRKRICIVAYANGQNGTELPRLGTVADRAEKIFGTDSIECPSVRLSSPDRFIGVDDGIPRRVYERRAMAIGNAVVPQAFELVGKLIISHATRKRQGCIWD